MKNFTKRWSGWFLDYEIVELLLTLGTPRKDCRQAAQLAIKEFKNFRGVMEADPLDLQKIKGIGPQNIFGKKARPGGGRRYLKDCMIKRPVYLNLLRKFFDYLYYSLRDLKIEVFKVLFLNTKNHILEEKTLFEGTVDSSAVYPREVSNRL